MKKLLTTYLACLCICVVSLPTSIFAQNSKEKEVNVFKEFKELKTSNEQFTYFFNTPNKYGTNSTYDWVERLAHYIHEAKQQKDTLGVFNYQLIEARLYNDIGDFERGLAIAKEVYIHKNKLPEHQQRRLLSILDFTYGELEWYDFQLEIREEIKASGFEKNVYFYDIYSNLGMYEKATRDYVNFVLPTIAENDFYAQAKYNNVIGNFIRLDGSKHVALDKFKIADNNITVYIQDILVKKTKLEVNESKLLKGIIEGNIGKCHVDLKNYALAIPKLTQSLETIEKYNTGKYSQEKVENTLALAECYINTDKLDEVLNYLNSNIEIKKSKDKLKRNALLALWHEKIEEYQASLGYLKKNVRLYDSLINNNQSEREKVMLAKVMAKDDEFQQSKFKLQQEQLAKKTEEIVGQKKQNDWIILTLVFALLFLTGIIFAYWRSIKNQRVIARQKSIIENALIEKDSLLKEIHHRVKNNLQMVSSLLSLQTKNTRSKAAIEALEEGKSRVKAMALIHQKLYQNDDLSVIEMQGYIESLINSVQSVYKKGGHNINITIDAEGVELDIDRAIPFGLILNELVSNSFKYAFPENDENGKIYIHLRKTKGQEGYFEYTDNGVGLPEDTDERANASMGMRLMNRLANQLQTVLNVDKKDDNGVRFWFNFK